MLIKVSSQQINSPHSPKDLTVARSNNLLFTQNLIFVIAAVLANAKEIVLNVEYEIETDRQTDKQTDLQTERRLTENDIDRLGNTGE